MFTDHYQIVSTRSSLNIIIKTYIYLQIVSHQISLLKN